MTTTEKLTKTWTTMKVAVCEIATSTFFIVALIILLPCLGVLLGLDIADRYARFDGTQLPVYFSLSTEGSFAEYFEYFFTFCAALFLLRKWHVTRISVYAVIAIAFFYLTLDNAFQIHENVGANIDNILFNQSADAQSKIQYGEMIFLCAIGLVISICMIFAMMRAPPKAVAHTVWIFGCFVFLAIFGVALDFLNSLELGNAMFLYAANFLEDGAELVIFALLFVLSLTIMCLKTQPTENNK